MWLASYHTLQRPGQASLPNFIYFQPGAYLQGSKSMFLFFFFYLQGTSHSRVWLLLPQFRCCCCLVAQSCPTLCNPAACSPPVSSVHGTLQARRLEWVVISSSRGSSRPRDRTQVSCASCIGRWILYH